MSDGSNSVIRVTKSLNTGAKKRIFKSEFEGAFPDNTTNSHRVGTASAGFVFFGNDGDGVGVKRVDFVEGRKSTENRVSFENKDESKKGNKG